MLALSASASWWTGVSVGVLFSMYSTNSSSEGKFIFGLRFFSSPRVEWLRPS